jgi:hypothetical protein
MIAAAENVTITIFLSNLVIFILCPHCDFKDPTPPALCTRARRLWFPLKLGMRLEAILARG